MVDFQALVYRSLAVRVVVVQVRTAWWVKIVIQTRLIEVRQKRLLSGWQGMCNIVLNFVYT
jgi:hypothetical protein